MTLQPHAFPNDQPRRRTILLVEDEPFVREATCGILESAGFEVLQAENASDAAKIYQARTRRIDLLMTDMVLPGRSGLQLGQDLREHCPDIVVLVDIRLQQSRVPGRSTRVTRRIFWRSLIPAEP